MTAPHPKTVKSPHAEAGIRTYTARGPSIDKMALERSHLPDAPCFRCGDRGWCKHRSAGTV